MKKIAALLLCLPLLLVACTGHAEYQKYSMHFFESFDTMTQVIGFAENEETFTRITGEAEAIFRRLHQVYDGYSTYPGVNNLCAVNQKAGQGPTPAEPELIALLRWCKQNQPKAQGTVNIALGSVLSIWHDYREEGTSTPPMEDLKAAFAHTNFDDVILDEQAGTVAFADPRLQLDVGAVAKGYAVELLAQWMLASDMPSFIISAGGNVRAGNPPQDGRLRWGVSIQNPDSSTALGNEAGDLLDVLYLANTSVVTSGDYQRFYEVDGVRYHHLIDPTTLMPATYMRAVTVVTEDSGLADLYSSTVFLMPYEQGRAFVEQTDGLEAYWVLTDGSIQMTDGLTAMVKSRGATSK